LTDRHLKFLHDDLLRSAGSAKLSLTHGAAALNALCGFLEQCSQCTDPDIRALPFAFHSWTKAFQILLLRTENNKAKPVRWLLLTLTSLISRHPVDDLKLSLIAHVIYVATQAIRGQDEVGSIKAALQVLEQLLSIKAVDAFEIVQKITPQQLKPDRAGQTARVVDTSEFVDTVQSFTSSVLQWAQYPDCVPAVGRFLSAFFASLGDLPSQAVVHGSASGSLPLWISPVKQSLEREPRLLEVYENHILPGLLRLSPAERKAFLGTLPLDQIQQGNGGKTSLADIQLCLLVARVESSMKLEPALKDVIQKREDTNVESVRPETERLVVKKECIEINAGSLGINLLEHFSPAVRISAFSLLVSSSISSRLFSGETVSCLQRCIPFFHVEASAKARNQFIASMKKLCVRLRGTIMSLIRDHQGSFRASLDQTDDHPPEGPSSNDQKVHDLSREIQRHVSFQSWYIRFLVHELRPTASYQSHITALRILHSLLEGNLLHQTKPSKANEQYIESTDEQLPSSLLLRPLLDLLLDPFDDVRQVANMIIKSQLSLRQIPPLPKPNGEARVEAQSFAKDGDVYNFRGVLQGALKRAESKAAETGRADHADGVGRIDDLLYGSDNAISILDRLLYQLEEEIKVARNDLLLAVSSAPLHGHLIALR